MDVDLVLENGFSPDCLNVMMTGRASLRYWDGRNQAGAPVAEGINFASVSTGRNTITAKVAILR
jgi:hypothetical protein